VSGVRTVVGKRHRQKRKVAKVMALRLGVRETELGELRRSVSKAEARQFLIQKALAREKALVRLMARATADIQAMEDDAFVQSIERAIQRLHSDGRQ